MIASLSFEPFALWHAQHHAPELAGAPLVALAGERVVAANPAAHRAGIDIGMGRAGARAHAAALREVAAVSPQLEGAWRGLVLELYAFTPRLEATGLGALTLQLGADEAGELAAAYHARAGAGASYEQARLLALAAHPGRLRAGGAEAVAQLPLTVLHGLGMKATTLERLGWLGIERLGALQGWRPAQLAAFLGTEADEVIRHLHGPHRSLVPTFTPPPTVRSRFTFDEPACDSAVLEPALARLARCVAGRLGDRTAAHLTLHASAQGIAFSASRVAKVPLRTPGAIERLARLALDDGGAQPLGIEALTLELTELSRSGHQGTLWHRRERLERAVAGVEGRFPGSLLRIEAHDPFALAFEQRARLIPWRAEGGGRANATDAGRGRSAPRVAQPRR